jgi:hypothetical protein
MVELLASRRRIGEYSSSVAFHDLLERCVAPGKIDCVRAIHQDIIYIHEKHPIVADGRATDLMATG